MNAEVWGDEYRVVREAMDWAAMLYRMYGRYCERKGWEVEPADFVAGEEAGIARIVKGINTAHGRTLHGYCMRLARNQHDAEPHGVSDSRRQTKASAGSGPLASDPSAKPEIKISRSRDSREPCDESADLIIRGNIRIHFVFHAHFM